MILSSASDAHGRRTSSSKVLPRPRAQWSIMEFYINGGNAAAIESREILQALFCDTKRRML